MYRGSYRDPKAADAGRKKSSWPTPRSSSFLLARLASFASCISLDSGFIRISVLASCRRHGPLFFLLFGCCFCRFGQYYRLSHLATCHDPGFITAMQPPEGAQVDLGKAQVIDRVPKVINELKFGVLYVTPIGDF